MRVLLVANLNLSGLQTEGAEPEIDSLVPPMGLLSLAAVLERAGHEPAILDFNYEIDREVLRLDASFFENAVRLIIAQRPDLVGFSTMCNSFHITLKLAQLFRRDAPHVPILLGGPQVSYVDEETLSRFPFIDYVIRGEAEDALPKFIAALQNGQDFASVPGLSYRTKLAIVRSPAAGPIEDLDALPNPAWHLFPYDVAGAYSIDVGRGCPFSCDFCCTSDFFARRFRLKSFDRLLQEVRWLQSTRGAGAITFIHDLFTANRKWVRALCERLLQEDDLEFSWSASARVDTVDRDLLHVMGKAGCRALFFGIESGSQSLQYQIKKRLKISTVYPVASAAAGSGIAPTLSFIAGFPTETTNDLSQTFELISQLVDIPDANIQLHLMSPQLGTRDLQVHRDKLCLDGYFSDLASGPDTLTDIALIRSHPDLFPSFYYYDNDRLPRELVVGADKFVRLICANMKYTLNSCREHGLRLWDLYVCWNQHCRDSSLLFLVQDRAGSQYATSLAGVTTDPRGKSNKTTDDYILEFAAFVTRYARDQQIALSERDIHDEILAFYLTHYHQVGVQVARNRVPSEMTRRDATYPENALCQ
jgi:radical SAM superfamily enzyme YgiQ (UPF0313 family)